MLFNSYSFLVIFLPIAFLGYLATVKYCKTNKPFIIWMVFCSIIFYGQWDIRYVPLILFSILANYGLGHFIVNAPGFKKKVILVLGLILNLGLLGYFKYIHFLRDNLAKVIEISWDPGVVILPLAISFFTFQQIGFLMDCYSENIREKNFWNYTFFVTFFPQLIAGPIVHHKQILPQLKEKLSVNADSIAMGLTLFTVGIFKKVILADNIAVYSSQMFAHVKGGGELDLISAWVGTLCYTFQIYFDFSGYSDMAIGLGCLFNLSIPINFNSPYKANSIIEFWRRWHITLSTFLRDYLYIPLGGNRKGKGRRYFNLVTTMLLGGLWHGAGWAFLLWGGLHGIYLILNHGIHALKQKISFPQIPGSFVFARGITFLFVVLAWVPFRAEDLNHSLVIYKSMFSFDLSSDISVYGNYLRRPVRWVCFLFFVSHFMPNVYDWLGIIKEKSLKIPSALKWRNSPAVGFLFAIVFTLTFFELLKISEFLYFQF